MIFQMIQHIRDLLGYLSAQMIFHSSDLFKNSQVIDFQWGFLNFFTLHFYKPGSSSRSNRLHHLASLCFALLCSVPFYFDKHPNSSSQRSRHNTSIRFTRWDSTKLFDKILSLYEFSSVLRLEIPHSTITRAKSPSAWTQIPIYLSFSFRFLFLLNPPLFPFRSFSFRLCHLLFHFGLLPSILGCGRPRSLFLLLSAFFSRHSQLTPFISHQVGRISPIAKPFLCLYHFSLVTSRSTSAFHVSLHPYSASLRFVSLHFFLTCFLCSFFTSL